MAKKTKAKTQINPEMAEFAEALSVAYYDTFKRKLNLDLAEVVTVIEANATDQTMAKEWWFAKLQEAEQAEAFKTMQAETTGDTKGISLQELVSVANADGELQSLTHKFVEAKDFPAKAPAQMAWRMFNDYTEAQLNAFPVPLSDQKTHRDAWDNDIGENMRKGYRWDKYYAKAVTGETIEGSKYQDFADDTHTGRMLVAAKNALNPTEMHEGKDNVPVTIDGVTMDVLRMDTTQRKSFYSTVSQRRTALATAYRKSMQIINKINEINERLGNIRKNSKITRIGSVHAGFVMLDPTNLARGLSPSKHAVRLTALYQEDVKDAQGNMLYTAGMLSNNVRDILVSEVINLDIDKAFVAAGKAGRELPNVNEVVSSKHVKKETTAAGDKSPVDKKATISANALPQFAEGVRLLSERDGAMAAWMGVAQNLKREDLERFGYDLGEAIIFLNQIYTKTLQEYHDKIANESPDKEQKAKQQLEDAIKKIQ